MALFMNGTSTSKSYMVVARRGKNVLGVKPINLVNGGALSLPGNVVLVLNLRASPMDHELQEVFEIGEQKVVSIGHALDHKVAFPEIEFLKVDEARCSVPVYLPFKETLAQNKVGATIARLATSAEIEQALAKLLDRIGNGLVVTPAELSAHIKEVLDITPARAEAIMTKAKMNEELAEAVSGEVLVGGAMTAKLKEIAKKYQPVDGVAEDEEGDED